MHLIKYAVILLLIFTSCKKEDVDKTDKEKSFSNGILILNEGLFQHNNSTLSWIDLSNDEVRDDVFLQVNNRLLGDTGNDLMLYGGKIYIAVTGSSVVEVIDKNTLKSIKQIPFNFNNQSQEPRNLTSFEGKVFVSSFDGYVSAIDTTSLKISNRIKVGRNPEGICKSNGSLFVANSGGLDFQNPDSTVFEIDLSTLQVVDTFVVGMNPGEIIADDFENVYVIKRGNYTTESAELVKINTSNKTVTNLGIAATSFSKRNKYLYLSYFNYSNSSSSVSMFDCSSQSIVNSSLINSSELTTLYGVAPFKTNELICFDAMNFTNTGYLRFFNQFGNLSKSIKAGLNPNSIIHYE